MRTNYKFELKYKDRHGVQQRTVDISAKTLTGAIKQLNTKFPLSYHEINSAVIENVEQPISRHPISSDELAETIDKVINS